ncbi:MAG: GntR family transcriptional regulator [Gemmobacter sp.]
MGSSAKTDTAFDLLQRDILSGALPPGTPLRIAALSERYRVSATPLREALSRLAEKQLAVAAPNCGWRVAPVSLEEFADLQHARLVIETALVQEAIAHGTLDWEAGIVAAHYRLAQTGLPVGEADTPETRTRWIEAHDAFHAALLAGSPSIWLRHFHALTAVQLRRHYQALLFRPSGQPVQLSDPHLSAALSVPRHTALMEAVLSRDPARAIAALDEHIEITLAIHEQAAGATDGAGPPRDTTEKRSTERV